MHTMSLYLLLYTGVGCGTFMAHLWQRHGDNKSVNTPMPQKTGLDTEMEIEI